MGLELRHSPLYLVSLIRPITSALNSLSQFFRTFPEYSQRGLNPQHPPPDPSIPPHTSDQLRTPHLPIHPIPPHLKSCFSQSLQRIIQNPRQSFNHVLSEVLTPNTLPQIPPPDPHILLLSLKTSQNSAIHPTSHLMSCFSQPPHHIVLKVTLITLINSLTMFSARS